MLLQSLVDTIERLKTRLDVHGADLRTNETRTRMALIDPVLAALGWDPADPSLVVPEYNLPGSHDRADYALLRPDGSPAAILEAKKLGEPFEKHRLQMINYANMAGIAYAGLTDGNIWELYSVFEQKHIDDRRILKVSIANDAVDKVALKILILWNSHLASGAVKSVSYLILMDAESTFNPTEVIVSAASKSENNPPSSVETKVNDSTPKQEWCPLYEMKNVSNTPPPTSMRMPDGVVYEIRKWKDVLIYVVSWLKDKGMINEKNIQIQITKSRHLLNINANHPTGKPFREPRKISDTSIHVETHWSANDIVRHTKTLVHRLGQNPQQIYLR